MLPLQDADEALTSLHLSPQALQLFVVFSGVHVEPHTVSWQEQTPLVQSGLGCAHGVQVAPIFPQLLPD